MIIKEQFTIKEIILVKIKVNPNWTKEQVRNFRQKLKDNNNYCPCSIIKDKDHICPCKEFLDSQELRECNCGLYIKVEI